MFERSEFPAATPINQRVGEQRKESMHRIDAAQGVLPFGYFTLGKQRKVTCASARNPKSDRGNRVDE